MHDVRHRPPRPLWLTIPGVLFQVAGIFVLPFVAGGVAAAVFESSEVVDTLPALLGLTVMFLFPVSLLQLVGMFLKSRTEIRFWLDKRLLTPSRLVDVFYTHLRVVTPRGWSVLFAGVVFVVISIAAKWASFGLIATIGLFLFYITVGWTLFVSTFLVRTFERGLGRANSGIDRFFQPAVALQGETVDEVVRFRKIPVPWGYALIVEDPLHPRLNTESRYALTSGGGETEVRGRLRATPRGHYFLGPARFHYQDLLGITKVSIASLASTQLKVLPRIRPLKIIDPPRSTDEVPDVLTRPHRFATEDYFRFREYAAGDDTRRIHWRLSMKHGKLHVRLPETREESTEDVLLVIDSYLPNGQLLDAAHGADAILDALVDAALGIARELMNRGDTVTLLAAASGHDRNTVELEHVLCSRGTAQRWQDVGARVRWQSRFDIHDMLAEIGEGAHGVVLTARFTAPPPINHPGTSTTWCFIDPANAMGPPDPPLWSQIIGGAGPMDILKWVALLPQPAGSEDNAPVQRLRNMWATASLHGARAALRNSARRRAGATVRELSARGDAVYRIERAGNTIRLMGVRGRARG